MEIERTMIRSFKIQSTHASQSPALGHSCVALAQSDSGLLVDLDLLAPSP